jgi:hypothetical protein
VLQLIYQMIVFVGSHPFFLLIVFALLGLVFCAFIIEFNPLKVNPVPPSEFTKIRAGIVIFCTILLCVGCIFTFLPASTTQLSTQTTSTSSPSSSIPSPTATQVRTKGPTVVPSPSPMRVDTVLQTMQQFCTSVHNGDANTAFHILTPDTQSSNYHGDIQMFWSDFEEYSGTCNVISCNVTTCNVVLSSPAHKSCRDNFIFLNLGDHLWHISDWSSPNNSCA